MGIYQMVMFIGFTLESRVRSRVMSLEDSKGK